MNSRAWKWMWLVGISLSVACSPSSDSTEEEGLREVFVGQIEGVDALLAIVVEDGTLRGYSCGREDTLETHTLWFGPGPLRDEEGQKPFLLVAGSGSLEGEIVDDEAFGEMELVGENLATWTAKRVAPNTIEGLFENRTEDCNAGVIVLDEGSEEGPIVQGALQCAGVISQVTPLAPVALTDAGIEVEVPDQGESFFVTPAQVDPGSQP